MEQKDDSNIILFQNHTQDGFKNIMKGLGTAKDGREYTTYQMGTRIDQQLASNLYTYNWLARKVVDVPIDDGTRKWRTLLISDADEKKEVEDSLKEFDVKGNINLAFKWGRVFGGAVIIAVIEGDDLEMPLNPESVRPDSLKNFIVLDRYNIYPLSIDRDIMSDNFGNPEFYNVVRGGQAIHHTRLFKINGDMTTIRELEQNNYWGTSIFTKGFEQITDSGVVSQSISNLVYESNVDVYRIKGLNGLVAEQKDNIVVARLKLAHEMKSIINGIALDKEDEYDKKTNTFTQLPEIDDRFIQKVAGCFDIPVTRLLGISPSGQNATGESDMLNYYDNVQSGQENDLRPAIDWMDQIITSSLGLEEFEYEFKPLKQLTESEQAEVDSKNADRDIKYIDAGVILESDAMAELSENGVYITIDENRVEEEKKAEELELGFEPEPDPEELDPNAVEEIEEDPEETEGPEKIKLNE